MTINFIFKTISFLFFNSPIILSLFFLLKSIISFFKNYDIQFKKLLTAVITGILAMIITSITLMFLPQTSSIHIITFWIVRISLTFCMLLAIINASEGKSDGIKILIVVLISVISITFI